MIAVPSVSDGLRIVCNQENLVLVSRGGLAATTWLVQEKQTQRVQELRERLKLAPPESDFPWRRGP